MAHYKVVPVEQGDENHIMRLLERTFYLEEPLNQAVGLCETERCEELDEYCLHSMLEGLSFKAVDGEGNIVGVIINSVCPLDDNSNTLLSQAKRSKNENYQKIMYVLAKREAGAKLWERFPQDNRCVVVKAAATDPAWRRQGIMNELVKATEKATVARDIRLLRLNTTSAYSAMSAKRLGFMCVYSALCSELELDGRPLIVPEPPHVETVVYIKSL